MDTPSWIHDSLVIPRQTQRTSMAHGEGLWKNRVFLDSKMALGQNLVALVNIKIAGI